MFRLIPATIITAMLLLFVKVVNMVSDTESLFISSVVAQQSEKPSNVSAEKPEVAAGQGDSAKKLEDKKIDDKKTEDKKPTEEGAGQKTEEKKAKENTNVSKELDSTTDHRFTAVEVELLQSLSKRRDELNRWENNIQIKEAALDATQKRIEEKIKQIEGMKKQVALLLSQYNKQEDAKIHSLVKIYENMKPSEAARIFDEVEMPILLLVIDAMAEKKAAPILAAMNPKKAKQLTVELANERKINTKITTGVESQVSTPTTDSSGDTASAIPTPEAASSSPTAPTTPVTPAPAAADTKPSN